MWLLQIDKVKSKKTTLLASCYLQEAKSLQVGTVFPFCNRQTQALGGSSTEPKGSMPMGAKAQIQTPPAATDRGLVSLWISMLKS